MLKKKLHYIHSLDFSSKSLRKRLFSYTSREVSLKAGKVNKNNVFCQGTVASCIRNLKVKKGSLALASSYSELTQTSVSLKKAPLKPISHSAYRVHARSLNFPIAKRGRTPFK